MKDVLIYTAVSGRYVNYIPMWKLFIEASYPECDYYVHELSDNDILNVQKYYTACYRYVLNPTRITMQDYEYFYITDIDVMMLREKVLFHTLYKNKLIDGLYYNITRDASDVGECVRLTGLHFCNKRWFETTNDARYWYFRELVCNVTGNKPWDDEVMLAKIVKMSGIQMPKNEDPFIHHHGIHLGNQRNIEKYSEDKKRKYMLSHITKEWAEGWGEISKTKKYILEKEVLHGKDKQAYNEIVTVEKYVEMILKGVTI
jgi:hypothetical protein